MVLKVLQEQEVRRDLQEVRGRKVRRAPQEFRVLADSKDIKGYVAQVHRASLGFKDRAVYKDRVDYRALKDLLNPEYRVLKVNRVHVDFKDIKGYVVQVRRAFLEFKGHVVCKDRVDYKALKDSLNLVYRDPKARGGFREHKVFAVLDHRERKDLQVQ